MQIEANGAPDADEESNLLSTPAKAPAALAQSKDREEILQVPYLRIPS